MISYNEHFNDISLFGSAILAHDPSRQNFKYIAGQHLLLMVALNSIVFSIKCFCSWPIVYDFNNNKKKSPDCWVRVAD